MTSAGWLMSSASLENFYKDAQRRIIWWPVAILFFKFTIC